MASRGRSARQKGAQFERDIANYFTEHTGIEFKRGLAQTRGGGAEVADVTATIPLPKPLHFELKRQQRCNIKAAYAQAKKDAPSEAMCIAITKEDRAETFVTMRLEDWLSFFQAWLKQ